MPDSRVLPGSHNELLGRVKPSSNAVAAQNTLLRRMVLNEGLAGLGIKGFPAEGGLFASLLKATGLYRKTVDSWRFVAPEPGTGDPKNLAPAWQAATDLLEASAHRAIPLAGNLRCMAPGATGHQGRPVAGAGGGVCPVTTQDNSPSIVREYSRPAYPIWISTIWPRTPPTFSCDGWI